MIIVPAGHGKSWNLNGHGKDIEMSWKLNSRGKSYKVIIRVISVLGVRYLSSLDHLSLPTFLYLCNVPGIC